jgi:hypothetical protein
MDIWAGIARLSISPMILIQNPDFRILDPGANIWILEPGLMISVVLDFGWWKNAAIVKNIFLRIKPPAEESLEGLRAYKTTQ